ncbi:MAG: ABC transporter permease [Spirochaetales bacterium]|nr:MAG: ABC transporter permease [Spirochaetales bacterium]
MKNKTKFEKPAAVLKMYGFLVYFFLYLPLLVVVVFSFSKSQTITGLSGLTFHWYEELLKDSNLFTALGNSLLIGLGAVSVSLIFGTAGALFFSRVRFPAKGVFRTMVLLPYVLPGIIMGLSLLIFFKRMNMQLSMFTVLLGHVSFTTPVIMFQVTSRLQRMGRTYQMAAMDLGATPVRTLWFVTLPMIRTSLIGGALMAFTISFDEIVISYFLTGSRMTLPVYLYGMMRFGLTPKVYAISALILVFSLGLILLMSRYLGRSDQARVRVRRA